MSVTITIKSPHGGHVYTIETPLESVASTKQDVTYEETQQMISEYAARTVNSIVGGQTRNFRREYDIYCNDREYYNNQRYERHDRNIPRSPDYNDYQGERRHRDDRSRSPARNDSPHRYLRDRSSPLRDHATHRRELDSRYVHLATGYEQLTDPESLMVGVGPVGTVDYKFIIKKYTPLRRLVNAYAGLSHINVDFFELQWQGDRIGWGDEDTAEKYGVTTGCELAIAARSFVRSPNLLAEYGPREDQDYESESEYEPEIKSESEEDAAERYSTNRDLRMLTAASESGEDQPLLPKREHGEESDSDSSDSSMDTGSDCEYVTAKGSD